MTQSFLGVILWLDMNPPIDDTLVHKDAEGATSLDSLCSAPARGLRLQLISRPENRGQDRIRLSKQLRIDDNTRRRHVLRHLLGPRRAHNS